MNTHRSGLWLVGLFALGCAGVFACETEESTGTEDTTAADAADTASDLGGDAADSAADTVAGTANATLEPSCAPDDGQALKLVVVSDTATCGLDLNLTGGLHFTVYSGATLVFPITAPQTITLGTGADGYVSRCGPLSQPVPCDDASTGTITFETYEEGVGASGSWTADFGQGVESGTFEAVWCIPDPPLVCG